MTMTNIDHIATGEWWRDQLRDAAKCDSEEDVRIFIGTLLKRASMVLHAGYRKLLINYLTEVAVPVSLLWQMVGPKGEHIGAFIHARESRNYMGHLFNIDYSQDWRDDYKSFYRRKWVADPKVSTLVISANKK